jgi:glycosyltransferase involved in cell wall biosynthesis
MSKTPCTVGILTFNSGKNLRRALESVKDFSDIIISDGGSTDDTLEIAKEYGCTIIEQYTKNHPSTDKYHPIEDFSRERNLMLDVAKEEWYLWIDSDEYISDVLREEIKTVIKDSNPLHHAYEIPIAVQSPDASVTYRQWKQTYQIRFFNLKTGGRFQKVMHERFVFDRQKFSLGRLKGCWYVPLSKPDFKSYSRAVQYRIQVMLVDHPPKNLLEFLHQGVFIPFKRFLGFTYRAIMMRLSSPWREVMPLYYLRNQYYSQWVTFTVVLKLYIEYKKKQ